MIIGHRGYVKPDQSKLVENTVLAFEQAFESGAEGIEFDIHITKDGFLVCYHDFTLQKLNIDRKIRNMTLEEIKALELPEDQKIPTLEEIFRNFKNKLYLNIEIKAPEAIYQAMNKIEEHNLKERCLISSFHPNVIKTISEVNKGFHTGLLYVKPWKIIEKARGLNCNTLHPYYGTVPFKLTSLIRILQNRHLKLIKKYGFVVNTWTVNIEKDALFLAKMGVTGVITDITPTISYLFSQ
ncbi:MAG: glycerophosphodiester phosphodiesterase [Candidatus Hermodarchaeota archaeon]